MLLGAATPIDPYEQYGAWALPSMTAGIAAVAVIIGAVVTYLAAGRTVRGQSDNEIRAKQYDAKKDIYKNVLSDLLGILQTLSGEQTLIGPPGNINSNQAEFMLSAGKNARVAMTNLVSQYFEVTENYRTFLNVRSFYKLSTADERRLRQLVETLKDEITKDFQAEGHR